MVLGPAALATSRYCNAGPHPAQVRCPGTYCSSLGMFRIFLIIGSIWVLMATAIAGSFRSRIVSPGRWTRFSVSRLTPPARSLGVELVVDPEHVLLHLASLQTG